jgi:phosphopantothenate-cysteine ligase
MEHTEPYIHEYGYGALVSQQDREKIRRAYATQPEEEPYAEVIVTAGGTKEPIDDVRYIGNFSAGRFGLAIAAEYAQHGHHVTLLTPQEVVDRFGMPEAITHVPYTSAESLKQQLLGFKAADLILHAAAVADYTPVKVAGKIASDQEALTLRLERTPKILSLLRGHFGEHTTIAGFKLLNGVSTEELTRVAKQQLATNQTDYSVANLLDDITPNGNRRILLVDGKKDTITAIEGTTAFVAQSLYKNLRWTARRSAYYA